MSEAVITGIGVIAPNGATTELYWEATTKGVSGLDRITRFDPADFPVSVAGEVLDAPLDAVGRRLAVQTDLWTQFGLIASAEALDDAEISPAELDAWYVAVVTASSSGGNAFGQREIQELWSNGPRSVSAYQSIAWFYAATTGQISIAHGMKGPCAVVASEGAGGLDAIGKARRTLRQGTKLVLTGGTEAPIGPYALACQTATGCLSPQGDPTRAYQPFGAAATGFVPGEGGAIMTLEEGDDARRRGTRPYAAVAGYASTHDGARLPTPDGRALARAAKLAMDDARVLPEQVDVVYADGLATSAGDAAELNALRSIFGDQLARVAVTVPKTMVGRIYAGGAALDVATAALSMRDGRIPPTVGIETLRADCHLDLVRDESREARLRIALILARGFGGFNAAIVLRAV
jgi:act minimal PKS chain-length factor (CLF/KS beta)